MKTQLSERDNNVQVLKITGRLAGEEVRGIQKKLPVYLTASNKLVIDCSELEYLDSSGLGALISSLKSAISGGGDLRLASVPNKVRMMLEITRADRIFRIYQTVDDAVSSYEISDI